MNQPNNKTNQPNNKTNQTNNKSNRPNNKISGPNNKGRQSGNGKLSNANAQGALNQLGNAPGSKGKAENFRAPAELSALPYCTNPETCEEMLNTFGTYNIQPTANTDNEFPAIAQGSVRQNPKNFKAKR